MVTPAHPAALNTFIHATTFIPKHLVSSGKQHQGLIHTTYTSHDLLSKAQTRVNSAPTTESRTKNPADLTPPKKNNLGRAVGTIKTHFADANVWFFMGIG